MSTIYTHLPQGSIRLLKFLDVTGLRCSLDVYGIENAPPYACLSYCWEGDDDEDIKPEISRLSIGGHETFIRDSLQSALRALSHTVRERGLLLWVDAICINQEDLVERAEQVRLMKRLYEGASVVLSWIGTPSNDGKIRQAVHLLEYLLKVPADLLASLKQRADLDWWTTYLHGQRAFRNHTTDYILTAWEALIKLFKRRYWSRTWVHQEVTLPNVRFFCGEYTFDWSHLLAFNAFHSSYGGNRQVPDSFQMIFARGASVGSPFLDLINAYMNRKEVITHKRTSMARLPTVVRDLRLTSCIDPRDRIFAALPHASDLDMTRDEALLAVDYTKEIVDIYKDLTQYLLSNARGLEIVGYICSDQYDTGEKPPLVRRSSERSLPSWVPDWRVPSRIRPLNSTGILHGDYNVLYEPCPRTKVEFSVSGNVLNIRGFLFDTIRNVTSTCGREEDATSVSGLRQNWLKELQDGSHRFTNEAFARTLVADAKHITNMDDNRDTNVRSAYVDWDVVDHRAGDLDQTRIRERGHLLDAIRCVCRDRRGGTTDHGCLGLFPEATVPGDRIAAFHGGNTLYVVRPSSIHKGLYCLVGECYVDGMMDGQVMALAESRAIVATDLLLV